MWQHLHADVPQPADLPCRLGVVCILTWSVDLIGYFVSFSLALKSILSRVFFFFMLGMALG